MTAVYKQVGNAFRFGVARNLHIASRLLGNYLVFRSHGGSGVSVVLFREVTLVKCGALERCADLDVLFC